MYACPKVIPSTANTKCLLLLLVGVVVVVGCCSLILSNQFEKLKTIALK
jgi:hypothetical protein